MSEPETMPEDPKTTVAIHRHDDGSTEVVFMAGVTAADIAAAFASLPADTWMTGIQVEWFSRANNCEGQEFEDEDHCLPLTEILMMHAPAELPAEAEDRS
jgi:hypothetical protein